MGDKASQIRAGKQTCAAGAVERAASTALTAPLVTVVVPAFNAERTIGETLSSVRAQTYRNLEIIVVDDGSSDATASIVEANASEDERVRLIRQDNSGVAAARNCGIRAAQGGFVAPVDADDLWRPTKIEKQMAEIFAGGPRCGLVYTWQARIDATGRILDQRPGPAYEGDVTPRLLYGNFLGSGSLALIRKEALDEVGGYDSALLAQQAQGCEDWKLYLEIASRYRFGVVKEHLTGYRQGPGRMSTDRFQMLRSHELVRRWALDRFPEHAPCIRKGFADYLLRTLVITSSRGNLRTALNIVGLLARRPTSTLGVLMWWPIIVSGVAARAARRALVGPSSPADHSLQSDRARKFLQH